MCQVNATLYTDLQGSSSEAISSGVIDESLPNLAGEVVAAQYIHTAEVDQREEDILKIKSTLYRGAVLHVLMYLLTVFLIHEMAPASRFKARNHAF